MLALLSVLWPQQVIGSLALQLEPSSEQATEVVANQFDSLALVGLVSDFK